MRSILFVCTANICRSPMAEGAFKRLMAADTASGRLVVDSAGTGDYHSGKPPFPLAVEAAKRRGYDITGTIARRISAGDFDRFDLLLAMDKSNVSSLLAIAPTRCKNKIELLLDYSDVYQSQEVPDPYGGTASDFDRALDMIEDGCLGLARLLVRRA
jgi:protein-tyrosine phosphatase